MASGGIQNSGTYVPLLLTSPLLPGSAVCVAVCKTHARGDLELPLLSPSSVEALRLWFWEFTVLPIPQLATGVSFPWWSLWWGHAVILEH